VGMYEGFAGQGRPFGGGLPLARVSAALMLRLKARLMPGGQVLNCESVQARWPGRGCVYVAGAGSGSVHALLDAVALVLDRGEGQVDCRDDVARGADAAVVLRLEVRLVVVVTTAGRRGSFYPRICLEGKCVSLHKSRIEMAFLHNGGCLAG
jgi:hypothetical protein